MRVLSLAAFVFLACGSPSLDSFAQRPVDESQRAAIHTISLQLEPIRPLDSAEPVTAIKVVLSGVPDAQVVPYVVEGTVSQVSLNKLAGGELTSTLAERVVPTTLRALNDGWRIRPMAPLLPGEVYSVISAYGEHGKFTVGPASRAYLARVWPPASVPGASLLGIYCGANAPIESADIKLERTNVRAQLLPALDNFNTRLGRCVRLVWGLTQDIEVQPPTEFENFSFDPAMIPTGQLPDPPSIVTCGKGELPFGPGCAIAESGRIIVRPPLGDSLWALGIGGYAHIQVVKDGARFVIPDLGTGRTVQLVITVFDIAGRFQSCQSEVSLPPPGPRIVINEVMSNPAGLEPAQEWIELVNAGTSEGNLEGLILKDSGIGVPLPSVVLHPGEYALVVRDDFDSSQPGDVPAVEFTKLIRIPQIGQNGLSNAGEPLSLLDANGSAISSFPAAPAKTAGVSVARREWWTLDDEIVAFGPHGGRGASPGAANYFDD